MWRRCSMRSPLPRCEFGVAGDASSGWLGSNEVSPQQKLHLHSCPVKTLCPKSLGARFARPQPPSPKSNLDEALPVPLYNDITSSVSS